jgi:predicted dehydrogenase
MKLDAVFVTTPIPSHYAIAKTLIERKVAQNIFVEKTLAANYTQAKELSELAKAHCDVNMVGYLRRFCVTFKKAKELLLENAIGEVQSFEAYSYSSDFLGVDSKMPSSSARGGVMKDLGSHAVDLALWFFGDLEVREANSIERMVEGSGGGLGFSVTNSDGVHGKFSVSWCMENYRMPEVGLSVAGASGSVEVNDDRVRLTPKNGVSRLWYRHDLGDNIPFWLGLPEYYREDQCFLKSVAKGEEAQPSFHAASKVDDIICQVEERIDER